MQYYPLHNICQKLTPKKLSVYNLLHRNLEEKLMGCKKDLEAKERENESLRER